MKRDREMQYNSPKKGLGNPNSSKENSSYAPGSPKLAGRYKKGRTGPIQLAEGFSLAADLMSAAAQPQAAQVEHYAVEPQAAPEEIAPPAVAINPPEAIVQPDEAINPPEAIVQPDVAINPPAAVPDLEPALPPHLRRNCAMTHFDSYINRQIEAPRFLTPYNQRIFDLLHQQGNHFLYQNSKKRYWANYPSHEKAFILPHPVAVHQLHLSTSPFAHNLRGTWVSAIAKNRDGKVYPVHIITYNTLRNNSFACYPKRINDLFEGLIMPWPEDMQKLCLIIGADTEVQKRKIIADYETAVTSYGIKAAQLLPDIRIYFERRLTKTYTPENCRQIGLRFFRRADQLLMELANKHAALLLLERTELKAIRPDVPAEAFIAACSAFIRSPNMAQELATTHFSITEINNILNLLARAQERMRHLHNEITTGFNERDLASEDVNRFLGNTIESINRLGNSIAKLTSLRLSYLRYSTALANMLSLDISHLNNIYGLTSMGYEVAVLVETNLYNKVSELMTAHGLTEQFRNHFPSGKKLLAWLIARNVPINTAESSREQCRTLVEHITLMITPQQQPLLGF